MLNASKKAVFSIIESKYGQKIKATRKKIVFNEESEDSDDSIYCDEDT
jgi:hypothetical protein